MSIFDNVRLLAQQQKLIALQESNVKLWQANAMLALRNQRDLLIFFIHALDIEDHDGLHDALMEMLIKSREEIARMEEHIL